MTCQSVPARSVDAATKVATISLPLRSTSWVLDAVKPSVAASAFM